MTTRFVWVDGFGREVFGTDSIGLFLCASICCGRDESGELVFRQQGDLSLTIRVLGHWICWDGIEFREKKLLPAIQREDGVFVHKREKEEQWWQAIRLKEPMPEIPELTLDHSFRVCPPELPVETIQENVLLEKLKPVPEEVGNGD